jgi:hypothetical protein
MVIETCFVVCKMKYSTDVTFLSFIHRIQQQRRRRRRRQKQQQQQQQLANFEV